MYQLVVYREGVEPLTIRIPDEAWARYLHQAMKAYADKIGATAPQLLLQVATENAA